MKKTVSFLTVIALLFSFSVCFADYSDLSADDECYDAVSRLRDFGIMSGYEDGTFKPDNNMTRAETARLLCSVINNEGADEASEFSDVPDTYWADGYIALMKMMDVISGYEDGTFCPENNVTYAEFLKMTVSLLGYGKFAEMSGGYPKGYIKYAGETGLDEGLSYSKNDIIKRREAAIIINRALDVPLVVVQGYETTWDGTAAPVFEVMDYTGNSYQTPLTYFHGIYTAEGIIGKEEALPVWDNADEMPSDNTAVEEEISQSCESVNEIDAYSLMNRLGIMPFEENIDLLKPVTRGEFAKYASRLTEYEFFTKKTSSASAKAEFSDVAKNSAIYSCVDIMTQSGYMEGFSEKGKKLFKPDDEMTEEECIGILMKMLKHDISKIDCMAIADKIGMTHYRKKYDCDNFDLGVLAMYLAATAELAGID